MKAVTFIQTLVLFLGISGIVNAQATTDDIAKEWERAKAYTKEYLDAMPDKDYSLKPTPDMRSFAEQMLHLADGNYGFSSAATGEKPPFAFGEAEKSTDKSKEAVTKIVMESYDFAINSIKKLTPAQLNEKFKLMDRFEITKEVAFEKAFEHQTHHRGQTAVYLRLAGVKPPMEKLF